MTELVTTLLTSAGLGIGAGVNAYATFLVFGGLARFYPNMFPGDVAKFFASTPVLIAMGVMYGIEFFADKFPAVDHVWDAVHTFIRPLAGGLVAIASANPEMPKGVVIAAGILGGGAALSSHLVKAGVRVGSTAATGGAANPFISVVEDIFAVIQAFVAIFLPWVILAVLILVIPIVLLWMSRRRRVRSAVP
ncbi:MAG: DUF4126 domain-containing protein [Thermoanaerobaculia bacterium]